ncbi:hypothetical protein [Blastococcus sp. CT_GayMR20]|uniref:hypothetical protein n=1 Tax=Blastococcus sp. CT_GayMR20 TaxID=2559609 RepID=UPI001FD76B05|nr:hypothetical protein [Blastococcus sp. CT_GayMR20]
MAEQLHDHPRVHVLAEQERGRGVPAVVQPDVPDAGLLEKAGPVVVVGLLVDRPAVGLGEDQVLVVPLGAGKHPLTELGGPVLVQGGGQGEGQGKGAVTALALGFLVDQTAADAVDAAPHGEGAGEQVDVLPLQRKRLGLAQAEGQRDGPAGGVAHAGSRLEDGACLAEVEGGGDLARALGGRVDEGGDVAGDMPALDGDGEGPGQDAVMAQHGGRGVAVGQQGGVELVEVFGPEPVDPVASDAGDQVLADGRLVAFQRPLSHPARRDGGEPVLEPPGDGRGRRLTDRPGVALALELSDLRHHDGAALAADVPAVECAVELEADGDVAVPAPIGALVDRRLAVRRASRHPLPLDARPRAQSPGALR